MSILMWYLILQTQNQFIFISQDVIYQKYINLNKQYLNFELINKNKYLKTITGELKHTIKTNLIYVSVSNYFHLVQSIIYMQSVMIIGFFVYNVTFSLSNLGFETLYIVSTKQVYYFLSLNFQMLITMMVQVEFLVFVSFLRNTLVSNTLNVQIISFLGILYVSNLTLKSQMSIGYIWTSIRLIIISIIQTILYLLIKKSNYRINDILKYHNIRLNMNNSIYIIQSILILFVLFLLNIGQIQSISKSFNIFQEIQNYLSGCNLQVYELFRMTYGLYVFYYIFLLIIISWSQMMILTTIRIMSQVYVIKFNRNVIEQLSKKYQEEEKELQGD